MHEYSSSADLVGLREEPVPAPTARQPGSHRLLVQSFILIAILWAGVLFGVDFIATPAKFLSPLASLPIDIDIGRRTFGVFNRVEDLFAALLLSVTLALPRIGLRRRAVLLLPLVPFAIKSFWLWPILDLDAIQVVGGLPSTEDDLHLVYVGLVVAQVILLFANGTNMLRRAMRAP